MITIKQSFAWWCVQDRIEDVKGFFKAVREIGYEGVELLPQHLWQDAIHSGLTIVSEGAGSIAQGLNRLENHAEIEAEVKRKIALAEKFGILNLIVFSGNRMGLEDSTGAENTIRGLKRLAPIAESSGITLTLELLNSKVDHLDYMCDHTDWAVDVVRQVNSPNIKILYDIYHMQIMEGNIIQTIRQFAPYFGHIHTAGVPDRRDLDDEQELNYPAIIRALKEVGYHRFIGHEFVPKGNPLDALRHSFELCLV